MKRLWLALAITLPLFAQSPIREASVGISLDELPAGSWQEAHLAFRYESLIARVAHGDFAGATDEQFELEAYPRLGARSYLYLSGAVAADGILYPDWRLGAEYYRAFGKGFEASAGYRRLEFDSPIDLATISLGKYAGNWLLQGRIYEAEGDTSWQMLARRYFGDGGTWLGARAGLGRDEIRSGSDVEAFDSKEIVAEGYLVSAARWTLRGRAGVTRLGDDPGFTGALAVGRRF
jgi:YaiO family outer membrane protein